MPLAVALALALLAEPPPPSVGLPRWQDAPTVDPTVNPQPLHRPRDGGVAIGLGTVAVVAGVGLLTGSILAAEDIGEDGFDLDPTGVAIGLGLGGGALLGGGIAMLASGGVRRGAYLRTDVGRAAPLTGRAMKSSGLVLIILGAATTAIGAVASVQRDCYYGGDYYFYYCEPPIQSGTMMGVGAASIGVGLGLTVAGNSWARERAIQPGVRVARDAVQLGVSGRF